MRRLAVWGSAALLVATGACASSTRNDGAAGSGRSAVTHQGGDGGANSAVAGAPEETAGTAGSSAGTSLGGRTATAGRGSGGVLAGRSGASGEGGDAIGASSGAGGTTGAGGATGGSGASGGTLQAEVGPVIVSLSGSDLPLLANRRGSFIEAVVTDENGVDDIVGGILIDPETGGEYDTFAETAEAGTYNIDLDWEKLNAISPLEANPLGGERVVRAIFWDKENHEASKDFVLPFSCTYPDDTSTITYGCCAGERVNMFDDFGGRCGSCVGCVAPSWSDGTTCADYRCRGHLKVSSPQACRVACASVGASCEQVGTGAPEPISIAYYGNSLQLLFGTTYADCSAIPPERSDNMPFQYQNCFCIYGEKPDWLEAAAP